tara:strand:+ start:577 stop:1578 length:1002 start_codon:yes stop_codon:yes gene_type:complete
MDTIPLRSPRYEILIAPATSVTAKLELTLDSTLRYTIEKSCTAGSTSVFEISELCRDYLTLPTMWTISTNYFINPGQVEISRAIKFYNSSGVQQGTTNTIAYNGFEGYGEWKDGANPVIKNDSASAFLISKLNSSYEVWAPASTSIKLCGVDTNADMVALTNITSGTSNSTYIYRSSTLNINVVDCTKYTPTEVYFINKKGALQVLFFFTKKVDSLKTKSETFQKNIIDTSEITPSYFRPKTNNYSSYPHAVETFNKNGVTSYKLSSGYYPERANTYFEELLMSEYVWIVIDNLPTPVTIKSSSMIYKTTLNDKLIEYSFDFTEAVDYINNIR